RPGQPPVEPDAAASGTERKRAQRAEIDAMLNEAMQPPLAPPTRAAVALGASEKAVAPLVDTLAAIDAAQQVIVENLRNIETVGFKGSRTAVGDGKDVARQLDVTDGELQPTHRMLDVAIQGDGFLQVQVYTPEKPESSVGFTRNGRLYMNRKGEVVVGEAEGYKLIPPLLLPPGTTKLTIDAAGRVAAARDTADSPTPAAVGRIHLARFTDPTALRPLGGGIYAESAASGPATESPAAERGAGTVLQGFLEASNVDLVRERLRLHFLQTWRAGLIGAIEALPYTPPAPTPGRRTTVRPAAGE
ncbi:MAG: flagellar basal-body rod protein FlgG, partial [Phycisphaerales bacterium]|nr:flagellar basal-body rod protein FlgG [Phycisphaerales bacterium]